VSRAPLPISGVTVVGEAYIAPERTLLPRHRTYGLMRQSRLPLLYFGIEPRLKSLCRLPPAPCCQRDLPDVISANLSPDAWPPPPAVPRSAFTCFFLLVIGLPQMGTGSASRFIPRTRFSTGSLSKLQAFLNVQASGFAHLPDRSYRNGSVSTGQPRILHPGISCFVTSARTGYASCLNTGNWQHRDFHPARSAALSAAPPIRLPLVFHRFPG
jgi:hypothetical protein